MKFLGFCLALALSSPVFSAPPNFPPAQSQLLPTPTPGLSEKMQEINFLALTKGTVAAKMAVADKTYKVRAIGKILVLYNHLDHAIIFCQWAGDSPVFVLKEAKQDPFPGTGRETLQVLMDEEIYTAKVINFEGGVVVVVYNGKGAAIFAMANPAPGGVLLPNTLPDDQPDPPTV